MSDFRPRLAWSDFVLDLADLLRAKGVDTPLYIVGGAVRDACLRRPTQDIDLVVGRDAIRLARRVTDWLGADIYVMDRTRGVARLFVQHDGETLCLDFADMRGGTLDADLRERDFTMNAMAADMLGDIGALIDPLGGEKDLRAKILRRCSPGAIANDPVRGLRAVRLSAQFALKIHPDTAADIRVHASAIRETSGERIRDEFFKLLDLGNAARGLRALEHLGLLREILPQAESDGLPHALATIDRLSPLLTAISARRTDNTAAAFDLGMLVIQLDRFRPELQAHLDRQYGKARSHGQLLVLAALLTNADDTQTIADSLRLSADEARKLRIAVGNVGRVGMGSSWSRLERHRYWRDLGAGGLDAILLGAAAALAGQGAALDQGEWLALVEQITQLLEAWFNQRETVVNPKHLLDGNAVKRILGIKGGPQIGAALTALREAQVIGKVADVDAARAYVAAIAAETAESS